MCYHKSQAHLYFAVCCERKRLRYLFTNLWSSWLMIVYSFTRCCVSSLALLFWCCGDDEMNLKFQNKMKTDFNESISKYSEQVWACNVTTATYRFNLFPLAKAIVEKKGPLTLNLICECSENFDENHFNYYYALSVTESWIKRENGTHCTWSPILNEPPILH